MSFSIVHKFRAENQQTNGVRLSTLQITLVSVGVFEFLVENDGVWWLIEENCTAGNGNFQLWGRTLWFLLSTFVSEKGDGQKLISRFGVGVEAGRMAITEVRRGIKGNYRFYLIRSVKTKTL